MAPHPVFSPGRIFLLPLAASQELSAAVLTACQHAGVSRGRLSITGALSCVTVGVFDPMQQVYVTHTETASLEILNCTGTVFPGSKKPARLDIAIIAADTAGKIIGGHLFAPTRIVSAQLMLQELLACPTNPDCDPTAEIQDLEPLISQEGKGPL